MPTASSAERPLFCNWKKWVPHLRHSFTVPKVGAVAMLCALLFLPLNAQRPAVLSTGQTLAATTTPTATILHFGRRRILLKRDKTVAPSSRPTLKLVAELPGEAILLTDTYPSRPAGLSRCQAGEEQFLRVITLKPIAKETFHLKVGSCRDNLELADDGLQWSPTPQTLTVHWLTAAANRPNPLILHMAPDGRPVP